MAYFCLIILSILFVIGIPMAIDWLIIDNSIPSNISNSEWVGFLGSYIGAIIGGVVSLIGIGVTIRFTKQQIALSQGQFSEQNRLNNEETFQKNIIEFEVYNIGLGAAYSLKQKLLNQQTEQGQQMMCILAQEKGEISNIDIRNNYYVISSM